MAFNSALTSFLQLERSLHPEEGNGRLYYNIANAYYQLEDYPMAVYYYNRALKLNPTNSNARYNLSLTLEKLNLKPSSWENSIFQEIFFFHYDFSLSERLSLFFFFALAAFLFISLLIWRGWRWLQFVVLALGMAALLLFCSLIYTRYFAPIEGILVHAAILYRDAGEQYAKAVDKPLAPGQKVEILDQRRNGQWVKILTPDGSLGYVKQDSIRVI